MKVTIKLFNSKEKLPFQMRLFKRYRCSVNLFYRVEKKGTPELCIDSVTQGFYDMGITKQKKDQKQLKSILTIVGFDIKFLQLCK